MRCPPIVCTMQNSNFPIKNRENIYIYTERRGEIKYFFIGMSAMLAFSGNHGNPNQNLSKNKDNKDKRQK